MSSSTDGMTQESTKVQLPDLSSILDNIDFERKPLSHGSQASRGRFSVGKWGSLIIELIAYPQEQDAILAEFGLTKFQFSELMGNPIFQAVYKDTESSIVALASNGGYQLSQRRLAEQGITVLEEIMASGEDKDRIKAVELAARLGNLDPLVQAKMKQENVAVNTGVQLVVNFGNGLKVPDAFKGGNVVIETTAEAVDEVE